MSLKAIIPEKSSANLFTMSVLPQTSFATSSSCATLIGGLPTETSRTKSEVSWVFASMYLTHTEQPERKSIATQGELPELSEQSFGSCSAPEPDPTPP